jgi:phospholipid/cholesterol/gamma-HCH transport system ATP-binding protein
VLSHGRVLGSGSVAELKQINDPWLRDYFAARAPNGEIADGN